MRSTDFLFVQPNSLFCEQKFCYLRVIPAHSSVSENFILFCFVLEKMFLFWKKSFCFGKNDFVLATHSSQHTHLPQHIFHNWLCYRRFLNSPSKFPTLHAVYSRPKNSLIPQRSAKSRMPIGYVCAARLVYLFKVHPATFISYVKKKVLGKILCYYQ